MVTTRHRSLAERGGRKALLETLDKKTMSGKKPIFTNLNKKIRAHRASSKFVTK